MASSPSLVWSSRLYSKDLHSSPLVCRRKARDWLVGGHKALSPRTSFNLLYHFFGLVALTSDPRRSGTCDWKQHEIRGGKGAPCLGLRTPQLELHRGEVGAGGWEICRLFITSEPHYSSLVGVEASRLGRPPEIILRIILVCKETISTLQTG